MGTPYFFFFFFAISLIFYLYEMMDSHETYCDNHFTNYAIQLKLTQCCMSNYISIKLKEKQQQKKSRLKINKMRGLVYLNKSPPTPLRTLTSDDSLSFWYTPSSHLHPQHPALRRLSTQGLWDEWHHHMCTTPCCLPSEH